MMRTLLVGIWCAGVALASHHAALRWTAAHASEPNVASPTMELRKEPAISVPIVADGALQGYIIAQFLLKIDATKAKELGPAVDAFVQDEAFRLLYGDDHLDFRHLDRFDLDALSKTLIERVNARLKDVVIAEVLVQEFNYLPTSEPRK